MHSYGQIFVNNFKCVNLNKKLLVLYLSGQNEKGRQQNNESEKAFVKTKEYVWPKNKDYVGGSTG